MRSLHNLTLNSITNFENTKNVWGQIALQLSLGPGFSYTPAVWRELTTFWRTLQIWIRFVRQRGNRGKPRYPILPLKQTNSVTFLERIGCLKRCKYMRLQKWMAPFCIMFLCIALSQLSSDSLLSWVACQGRDKNASLGPSINDVTISPHHFDPSHPHVTSFVSSISPQFLTPSPALKFKTSIIVGPFIVEPATFMHPSKFERKKNDRFFLATWW